MVENPGKLISWPSLESLSVFGLIQYLRYQTKLHLAWPSKLKQKTVRAARLLVDQVVEKLWLKNGSPVDSPGSKTARIAGTNGEFIPDTSRVLIHPHVFPTNSAWSGCLRRAEWDPTEPFLAFSFEQLSSVQKSLFHEILVGYLIGTIEIPRVDCGIMCW